jgi:hypothetical protein
MACCCQAALAHAREQRARVQTVRVREAQARQIVELYSHMLENKVVKRPHHGLISFGCRFFRGGRGRGTNFVWLSGFRGAVFRGGRGPGFSRGPGARGSLKDPGADPSPTSLETFVCQGRCPKHNDWCCGRCGSCSPHRQVRQHQEKSQGFMCGPQLLAAQERVSVWFAACSEEAKARRSQRLQPQRRTPETPTTRNIWSFEVEVWLDPPEPKASKNMVPRDPPTFVTLSDFGQLFECGDCSKSTGRTLKAPSPGTPRQTVMCMNLLRGNGILFLVWV